LHAAVKQVEVLTQRQLKEVFVDLGYRGAIARQESISAIANSSAASLHG
jgi:hypothetical protein